MKSLKSGSIETISPTELESTVARESSRLLAKRKLGRKSNIRIQFMDDTSAEQSITVPASALRMFVRLLDEMSQGHSVSLISMHAELTTQQAADILNVSRPYLVKLLDEGSIPVRTVGKYRRVRFEDLMAFKRKDDEAREKVLDQLTAEAQALGLGY